MPYSYGYNTKRFSEIFPDYATLKTFLLSTGLFTEETLPENKTFTLISFEYNDWYVAYTEQNFKEHFTLTLYEYYKEFEENCKRIDSLMSLTQEDIERDMAQVTNVAQVPETEASTDEDVMDFVTTQQKSFTVKGKLQVNREMLNSTRNYNIHNFLNKFKKLFRIVCTPTKTLLFREDDDK